MKREGEGISPEIAKKYPFMRAVHYSGDEARVFCGLKRRDVAGRSDKCDQLEDFTQVKSTLTDEGLQVTGFRPEPLRECADCPVSKTPPCGEDIEATFTLQTLKGERVR